MFKTILEDSQAEIVEKKSKFVANLFYVESVESAEEKIKEIKKKYYDARHNCYAYSIYTKEGIINKFSDDGEPSGTAGSPMLNILNSKKLCNVVVVVTRYFGGILLGTGGLVRAYTAALQEALKNTKEVERYLGLEVKLEVSYSDLEKLKYYLKQDNINIVNTEYAENVYVFIDISNELLKAIESKREELNFKLISINILRDKCITINE